MSTDRMQLWIAEANAEGTGEREWRFAELTDQKAALVAGSFSDPDSEQTELFMLALEICSETNSCVNKFRVLLWDGDESISPAYEVTKKFKGDGLHLTPKNPRHSTLKGQNTATLKTGDLSLDRADLQSLEMNHDVVFYLCPDHLIWTGPEPAEISSRRQREKAEKEQKKAVAKVGKKSESGAYFINPFTFVPLPEKIERKHPTGHHKLCEGNLSGSFVWELQMRSDLLVTDEAKNSLYQETGQLSIPGSTLRGSLRSLHETMAGGCMRVLDLDYVPVHREPMSVGSAQLSLVRVDEVTEQGLVKRATICSDIARLNIEELRQEINRLPYSGAIIAIDNPQFKESGWPKKIVGFDSITLIDDPSALIGRSSEGDGNKDYWVVHISDAGAKDGNQAFNVTLGKLTGGTSADIPSDALSRYRRECDGGRDLQALSKGIKDFTYDDHKRYNMRDKSSYTADELENARSFAAVSFKGKTIGYRRKLDGWLDSGDTIFAETAAGTFTVKRLKASRVWRSEGKGTVGQRLPIADEYQSNKPCTDPTRLCPTCQLFGSVDGRQGEDATQDVEQNSYGSHVRVGWASVSGISCEQVDGLVPLRSPKPSFGGFYLQHADTSNLSATDNDQVKSHWGSTLDGKKNGSAEQLRRIRGRKYYWHGSGTKDTPRLIKAAQATEEKEKYWKIKCKNGGIVISSRVSFDNITEEQLGWLLSAAEPSLLFAHLPECVKDLCKADDKDTPEWLIHIGSAKPLGFGSALPTVTELTVWSSEERYGNAQKSSYTCEDLTEKVYRATPEHLKTVHRALARVLAAKPKLVAPERITYPTIEQLPQKENRSDRQNGESFKWFAQNAGGRKTNNYANDLTVLPEAVALNQYLPIGEQDA